MGIKLLFDGFQFGLGLIREYEFEIIPDNIPPVANKPVDQEKYKIREGVKQGERKYGNQP
jgi:hypothetical protein